jgi:hypothetical protein
VCVVRVGGGIEGVSTSWFLHFQWRGWKLVICHSCFGFCGMLVTVVALLHSANHPFSEPLQRGRWSTLDAVGINADRSGCRR